MFKITYILLLSLLLAAGQGGAATVVGPHLVGDHYDITSIDPETGNSSVLVSNAFSEFWGGSFIINTTHGVGYAITDTLKLYQFDLTTGETLANPSVDSGGPLVLGANGHLLGLRFGAEGVNFVSINPQTGASTTLVEGAFGDFYGGSFISNPAQGVGYVITGTQRLYQFDLATGEELASMKIDFGGALALGTNGQLVGIRNTDGHYDLVSINPQTGATVTLVSNAFSGFYYGTFGSDPASNVGYVLTNTHRLYQFNLTTGQLVANPTVNGNYPALAFSRLASRGGGMPSTGADITLLIHQATRLLNLKAEFKNAVLLEADGATIDRKPTTTARGINKWRLVFNNQATTGSKFKSAYITYQNGKFGKIVGVKEPFLEDLNLQPPPTMTLTRAVQLVRTSGFKGAFKLVTLRYPVDPAYKAPAYFFVFQQSGLFVQVDTKTGKVKKLGKS